MGFFHLLDSYMWYFQKPTYAGQCYASLHDVCYRLYTVCMKCIFLFHLNRSCLASGISNSQNMLVVVQRRNATCVRQFSSNLWELYSTWFVHSCSKMITNRLQAAGWCHNFKTFKRCFCAPCQACEKKKKGLMSRFIMRNVSYGSIVAGKD